MSSCPTPAIRWSAPQTRAHSSPIPSPAPPAEASPPTPAASPPPAWAQALPAQASRPTRRRPPPRPSALQSPAPRPRSALPEPRRDTRAAVALAGSAVFPVQFFPWTLTYSVHASSVVSCDRASTSAYPGCNTLPGTPQTDIRALYHFPHSLDTPHTMTIVRNLSLDSIRHRLFH